MVNFTKVGFVSEIRRDLILDGEANLCSLREELKYLFREQDDLKVRIREISLKIVKESKSLNKLKSEDA